MGDHLTYELLPAELRRSRRLKRIAVFVVVFAVAAVSCVMVLRQWPHWRYLSRQSACLNYVAPEAVVVFDGDPSQAANLLSQRSYVSFPLGAGQTTGGTPGFGVYFVPREYTDLGWAPGKTPQSQAVAFMHERQSAGGLDRLIIVTAIFNKYHGSVGQAVILRAHVLTPATLYPGTRALAAEREAMLQIAVMNKQQLRLYAGQPDPADSSRFTIRYQIDGQDGWVDGQLRDPESWIYLDDTKHTCERAEMVVRSGTPAERVKNRPWLTQPNW